MKEIKKIQPSSLAKIAGLFYGIIGFFIAIGVAISAMANIIAQSDFQGSYIMVALFHLGIGILLGLAVSLLIGLLGWIFGFIAASLYNSFSKRIGGIKISLKDIDSEKK
jgi:membrane associated rhomboid family serine protease